MDVADDEEGTDVIKEYNMIHANKTTINLNVNAVTIKCIIAVATECASILCLKVISTLSFPMQSLRILYRA